MGFRGLFDRLAQRKEEGTGTGNGIGTGSGTGTDVTSDAGNDGWVELVDGKLVVHDPVADGRYATVTPQAGVQLWINEEAVEGPTAVIASDRIRFEVQPDSGNFFDLRIAPDDMSVEVLLTADPARVPDTVALVGVHQARLQAAFSPSARTRPGLPRQVVLDHLAVMGVTFGLDEAALDRELSAPTYQPVVIALGQEAEAPSPGQWLWRLDEWSVVEAGQVIAHYQDGKQNRPRISVKGQSVKVHDDLPQSEVYLAGNGTRLVPGGKLVASSSGRARAVPTPLGYRVHLFPVQQIDGDVEGELTAKADVIVHGNVRGARITAVGEVVVTGNVERSEIHADVITISGIASESRLNTLPAGHYLPLAAELSWIHQRVEAMREGMVAEKRVKEEAFRELQSFVRSLRRKAEQMGVTHPDFLAASDDLARVFLGEQGMSALDLPAAARMLVSLARLKPAEQSVRNVRAATLSRTTVWAGKDIDVTDKVGGSALFCGGSIQTPETASLSQSDLVAAGDVIVGVLASVRGTVPVTVRAGGRILAAEVQVGCAFEFGAEHKEFKTDLKRVMAGVNSKGQIMIRQRD